jgi:hypothetical protein
MPLERLTESQKLLLAAGRFRFDGWSHASDVLAAQALITAGYVTPRNVGGDDYTCIECIISDEGRAALGKAGRVFSEITPGGRQLLV